AMIAGCVVDGGGGEFVLQIPGQTDGWGLWLNAPATGTMTNCLAINKNDSVNAGMAFGVQYCNAYTGVAVPVQASMGELIAHGWTGPAFWLFSGLNTWPPFTGNLAFGACDLPGYTAPGVVPTPAYFDSTRTTAKYAKTLGF